MTGRRPSAISSPSETKIITHPLHDSRMRLQTNSVIEIEDSSARRTCSEFVRAEPATPHKHHICRNIFGRTPVALAGIYGTLSGFTYVWYYSGGKCGRTRLCVTLSNSLTPRRTRNWHRHWKIEDKCTHYLLPYER